MRPWLSPPTYPIFLISVILFILALIAQYGGTNIPVVSEHVWETLLVAYVVLLIGNLFRGL
jgi:hypothetical protein